MSLEKLEQYIDVESKKLRVLEDAKDMIAVIKDAKRLKQEADASYKDAENQKVLLLKEIEKLKEQKILAESEIVSSVKQIKEAGERKFNSEKAKQEKALKEYDTLIETQKASLEKIKSENLVLEQSNASLSAKNASLSKSLSDLQEKAKKLVS